MLQQLRLGYCQQVSPMDLKRYPHVALHDRTRGHRAPIGRSRKKWIDYIREDCAELGILITHATH